MKPSLLNIRRWQYSDERRGSKNTLIRSFKLKHEASTASGYILRLEVPHHCFHSTQFDLRHMWQIDFLPLPVGYIFHSGPLSPWDLGRGSLLLTRQCSCVGKQELQRGCSLSSLCHLKGNPTPPRPIGSKECVSLKEISASECCVSLLVLLENSLQIIYRN